MNKASIVQGLNFSFITMTTKMIHLNMYSQIDLLAHTTQFGDTDHVVLCRSEAEHQNVKCISQEFGSFIPWCLQNKYHPHSTTELKLTIFLFYLLIQSFGQC